MNWGIVLVVVIGFCFLGLVLFTTYEADMYNGNIHYNKNSDPFYAITCWWIGRKNRNDG